MLEIVFNPFYINTHLLLGGKDASCGSWPVCYFLAALSCFCCLQFLC